MASESTGKTASGAQPDLPKKIHFVGIGGIGMSGLAQMFRDLGCAVTGGDRALGHPENERIFAALRKCGAKLFPQDGSVYADGYTPAYPLLYAQVTKRFKGVDLYVGGENLTNYRQHCPILGADEPFSDRFDASCVWGPLMGIKIYAGIRVTIWKTE